MIGIAAASALATAAVVMWVAVPNPAITTDGGLEARNSVERYGSREPGSAPVDVAADGSRNFSPGGERLSPGSGGGRSSPGVGRGQATGASIFQMTASRVGASEMPHSQSGPAEDGRAEFLRNLEQVAAMGTVFFTGDDDEGGGVQDTAIVTPLAQLDPDPGIDWDEQAVAALKVLRESFAKSIAADRLDPANPEYAERWRTSQPASDEAYRMMFGQAAFEARQLEAARQALAQAAQESAPPAN